MTRGKKKYGEFNEINHSVVGIIKFRIFNKKRFRENRTLL